MVKPGMYLDEIQTRVVISHDVGVSKTNLPRLIEDVGCSYKHLSPAKSGEGFELGTEMGHPSPSSKGRN